MLLIIYVIYRERNKENIYINIFRCSCDWLFSQTGKPFHASFAILLFISSNFARNIFSATLKIYFGFTYAF